MGNTCRTKPSTMSSENSNVGPDTDSYRVMMKPSMVIQRPTDNAPGSEASSNSFPNWFPFRFGLGFDCDSGQAPCEPRTDVDITAHEMMPSPEKMWISPGSNLNPDEMRVMKSVLSELECDEGPLRISDSPMTAPKEKESVVPRRGRRYNKKQRAARPAQQASSPLSQDSRLQAVNLKCSSRDASPPPTVRMVKGLRVTVVSEEFKILVVDLLTPEQCDLVRNMADDHVRESGNRIPTWRTLYTYTKQDLPCGEVKHLSARVTDGIMEAVRGVVGEVYGNAKGAAMLQARSWKEPHLLLYQHLEGKPLHTGVEMHYDGCDVTWNCMLSKSSEYDGGGTYMRCLRKTVKLEQGQVLIHPGELYHKGCDITHGVRALIVCFMDGYDPKIPDPSSSKTDSEVFQQNVQMY